MAYLAGQCATESGSAVRSNSVAIAVLTIALFSGFASTAHSQSRTPNPDAPATLRTWPQSGEWMTVLGRADGHALVCSMITGKTNSGQIEYLATLNRWPTEWHLGLADTNQISGNTIALVVDGVRVGEYPITKRQDNRGPLHSVGAVISNADTTRVMNLFRTGETAQFITSQYTYTLPLTGAAEALSNMQNCILEANNLTKQKPANR